jgi:hypothetical protein
MATAASTQLYPFSTEKGEAIPLDVVRPLGVVVASLSANAAATLNIPSSYAEVSIRSTIDAMVDFTGTATYPLVGPYSSALLLHKDVVHTVQLPSTGNVRIVPVNAGEAGKVLINSIQKWAGIGLNRQLTRR